MRYKVKVVKVDDMGHEEQVGSVTLYKKVFSSGKHGYNGSGKMELASAKDGVEKPHQLSLNFVEIVGKGSESDIIEQSQLT